MGRTSGAPWYPPGHDACRLCSKVNLLCADGRCVECCLYGNGVAACEHGPRTRLEPVADE